MASPKKPAKTNDVHSTKAKPSTKTQSPAAKKFPVIGICGFLMKPPSTSELAYAARKTIDKRNDE